MSFLDFISNNASNLISSITGLIDNITTTDEERAQLKNALEKEINSFILAMAQKQNDYERELTQRQANDMKSDSFLSKNIRPFVLIFILVMFTILSVGNWFELKVSPEYTELLKTWGTLAFTFYFGGRTFEKITKIRSKD